VPASAAKRRGGGVGLTASKKGGGSFKNN